MREMITSLVAEGRTVVLSSHLLDEVERTCDAVAIVDRGKVIKQGSIADLLEGAAFELQMECETPPRAASLLAGSKWSPNVQVGDAASASSAPREPIVVRWLSSTDFSWKEASPSTVSRRPSLPLSRRSSKSRAGSDRDDGCPDGT